LQIMKGSFIFPLGNITMQVSHSTDIGKLIRQERLRQRLTQADLAGLCGVGLRFIIELEAGKPTVRLEMALRVLSMLGVTLTAEEPPTSPVEPEPSHAP
jgi:HTH-type transcriptional regulator/antitoxin HipB